MEVQEKLNHHESFVSLSEALPLELGSRAIEGAQAVESIEFDDLQINVLSLLSEGNTTKQIARKLSIPPKGVNVTKQSVSEKFPNLSVGVHYALQRGIIDTEYKPDPERTSQLTALDIGILQTYAIGGATEKIAEISGSDPRSAHGYEADLFKKIKAWSRPHAVRRAYELGIFSVTKEGEV